MSLTNHIIIPTVGSKQNLEDQNIFIPTAFAITPSKHEDLPDFTFWKKSSSAFKRFKQKKDKKTPRYLPNNQNKEPEQERPLPYLKLRQRHPNAQYHQQFHQQLPFGYYDPNQAPLYEMHLDHDSEFTYKPKDSKIKIEEQIPQIKLQRIQSSIINDEPKFIIEPRFDDPFIIIRKDHHKKNCKSIKTKTIKKDKNGKGKDVDQIKLLGGRVKEGSEGNKSGAGVSIGVNQLLSPPLVITNTNSEPPHLEQSSSNSGSSEEDEHSPTNKQKLIHSIKHFINIDKIHQMHQEQRYCTLNIQKIEMKEEEQERFVQ